MTTFIQTALGPYKTLKRDLGRLILQTDLMLLSWRRFVRDARKDKRGIQAFIEDCANTDSIEGLEHIHELPESEERMCSYFVVMIFESFETFLANCVPAADALTVAIPFKQGDKLYEKLTAVRKLPRPGDLSEQEWTIRTNVIDYYRVIRDRTVHPHLARSLGGEIGAYRQQWGTKADFERVYQWEHVPPGIGVVDRNDVRFCCYAVIDYAFLVSRILFDDEKLQAYVKQIAQKYGRFVTKQQRFRNAVVGRMCADLRIDRRLAEQLTSALKKL